MKNIFLEKSYPKCGPFAFFTSRFLTWPKKSGQKIKYLKNEKSFEDKIKSIFHHFEKAFIEANKSDLFWKVKVRLLKKGIIVP